jgi:hypothetical protein
VRTAALACFVVAAVTLLGAPPARAQWQPVPDRALRRASRGAPDLAAPAPKRDGRPDLSGVWLPDTDPLPPGEQTVEGDLEFPRHMNNYAADLKEEDLQIKPWAAELLKTRLEDSGGLDPAAHCKPLGMPFLNAAPLPYKIVETPGLVLVLYEGDTVFRQVFLDGREPVEDAVPRIMGYSTGKWQGDTLVVDTVGFRDRDFIDAMGHPHSDKLHLIERFRRPDVGHLEIEMTIDDPGAYLQPLTYTVKASLLPDTDLLEYFCAENEKDAPHYR